MESKEVLKLIENKSAIECKIVMTIYFSKPYYSASMMISADAIRGLLKQADPPSSCCEKEDDEEKKSVER
ncbi:hypothetical protein [Massilia sp. Leaf139]|uniref:hypothetical protein n=1 Tax=Massilia sp. Leaf139 TaxID=1736272 RepID=UPI000A867F13|nr:hypothetical protein [Massilia sp. Leaf139]